MTTELTVKPMTNEQIDLIKKTVAMGATDNELKLFLYQAGKRGLDPLSRQIHLVKRKRWNNDTKTHEEVATIQTGIDGFRLIADRTGKLSGIKRGAIYDDKGNLVRAWAEVSRKDWNEPAREEVSFREYCQHNKDGEPMGLWKTMPETMLKKVAEAAALRMAFPEDLSGLYSDDEMSQAEPIRHTTIEKAKVIETTGEIVDEVPLPEPEPEPPARLTAQQQAEMTKPKGITKEQEEFLTQFRQTGQLREKIKEHGWSVSSFKGMTYEQAEILIKELTPNV